MYDYNQKVLLLQVNVLEQCIWSCKWKCI